MKNSNQFTKHCIGACLVTFYFNFGKSQSNHNPLGRTKAQEKGVKTIRHVRDMNCLIQSGMSQLGTGCKYQQK